MIEGYTGNGAESIHEDSKKSEGRWSSVIY